MATNMKAIEYLKQRGYTEESKLSLKVVESLMERFSSDRMNEVFEVLNKERRQKIIAPCSGHDAQGTEDELREVFENHGMVSNL